MPNDLFKKFIECQTPYALLFIPKKNTGTRAYVFSGHEKIQPESFLSDNPELISFGYLSFEGEAFFYRSINNHFLEEDADHTSHHKKRGSRKFFHLVSDDSKGQRQIPSVF
jgi:hypothetical protein